MDGLRPGDIMVKPGHMELFAGWKNPASHSSGAWVYPRNGPAGSDWAKGPNANSHGQIGHDLRTTDVMGGSVEHSPTRLHRHVCCGTGPRRITRRAASPSSCLSLSPASEASRAKNAPTAHGSGPHTTAS